MEKGVIIRYLILGIIFISLLGMLFFLRNVNLTGRAVFEQKNETSFNPGFFENTEWNLGSFI